MENELVLTLLLQHLGSRVAVKTLEVHVRSFYDLLQINVPGAFVRFSVECARFQNLES